MHIFIVGSRGIPARYGGFETFAENLTAHNHDRRIKYHVSCMNSDASHFEHNNADCFGMKAPVPGALGRMLSVRSALIEVERWAASHPDEKVMVYILGCRIGPFLIPHSKKLHQLGVKIFCNPDGLEWKRNKWNALSKLFLKYCERCLIRNSDVIICDNPVMENYVRQKYNISPKNITCIAYGADLEPSKCSDESLEAWYSEHGLKRAKYYLVVGRFVPENNYETIIREFTQKGGGYDLVIISNIEHNKFYRHIASSTGFESDERIKFVGTVYDRELLRKIRENAYAYIHGHEVGGTNPSLLEGLAATKVNLILDVEFNHQTAGECGLYWTKECGSLARLIDDVNTMTEEARDVFGEWSREVVRDKYSWEDIASRYHDLWKESE